MRYRYGLPAQDMSFENGFLVTSMSECAINDKDLLFVVEDCAEDYFNNRNGWESRDWPKIFILWDLNGNILGKYRVEMEAIPKFYPQKLKNKKEEKIIT